MNPNRKDDDALLAAWRETCLPLTDPSSMTDEQIEARFPKRLAVLREMVAHALETQPTTPGAAATKVG